MSQIVEVFPSIQNRILIDCVIGIPDIINPIKNERCAICKALIDTGSMITAISTRAAEFLNAPVTGSEDVIAANNHHDTVNTHTVNIEIGKDIQFPLTEVSALDMTEYDIIIGMDLLSHGELMITNSDGRTVFYFKQYDI